jgi:hypothetical protein
LHLYTCHLCTDMWLFFMTPHAFFKYVFAAHSAYTTPAQAILFLSRVVFATTFRNTVKRHHMHKKRGVCTTFQPNTLESCRVPRVDSVYLKRASTTCVCIKARDDSDGTHCVPHRVLHTQSRIPICPRYPNTLPP